MKHSIIYLTTLGILLTVTTGCSTMKKQEVHTVICPYNKVAVQEFPNDIVIFCYNSTKTE